MKRTEKRNPDLFPLLRGEPMFPIAIRCTSATEYVGKAAEGRPRQ
jgi:hypothetical protein